MAYRVFVSSFQCESNTFCKTVARYEDFEILYGQDTKMKLAASKVFMDNGIDIESGVFASALPSGCVSADAFRRICDEIIQCLKDSKGVDGIYLYLHGGMYVQHMGSGEEQLVREIRNVVGDGVPIALALDFHANNTDGLMNSVNIIQGFRTAPHTDHNATEQRAAAGLVRCIKEGVLPRPVFARIPVLAADAAVTANSPLKEIMEKVGALDEENAVYSAAFFNGQPWVDVPYVGPCAVIMAKEEDADVYMTAVNELAEMFWKGRMELKLGPEAMRLDEAISYASSLQVGPVFITDSGDNTTAGAEGEGTLVLEKMLAHHVKNALICGITAKEAVNMVKDLPIGHSVDFWIGTNAHDTNIVPVRIQGTIKSCGKVLGWAGEECGNGVVIAMRDIDVVLTDVRAAFISAKHIENMGIHACTYKTVVVKLGYLFPELSKIASAHVFTLTPGASTNLFDTLDYQNIRRPMYPLDKDFEWERTSL